MNLGADGEDAALGRLLDELNDAFGRAHRVCLLTDLPAALGMNDNLDARVFRPHRVDMAGQEPLMDGAVSLPQDDLCGQKPGGGEAAVDLVRVPDGHLVKRNSHRESRISAEVLVGKKQDLLAV